MLKLAVFAVIAVAVVLGAPKPEDDHYKTRLDSLNVDEVLTNKRLVDKYYECAKADTDRKCTAEGKEMRVYIGKIEEILQNNCEKCTEDQKEKVTKILRFFHKERRADFDELLNKYDANKELRTKYKEKYAGLAKDKGFSDLFD